MAFNMTDGRLCSTCPDLKSPQHAEMYCNDCKIFLCTPCFKSHEQIPVCQDHTFISSRKALAMVEKEIDNKNMQKDFKNVSKIGMSHSTSEKMVTKMQISRDPWNVRNIQGSFCDIMGKLKHVKTIENLPHRPYRLGVVNGNIWMKHGEMNSGTFAVFDKDLNKVTEYNWPSVRGANTAQQVSINDVMITSSDDGLHVVNTEGKYQYKIMDGCFTDISVNNTGDVAVVEYKQNKVIILDQKHDKWQIQRHISFEDHDKDTKTLLLSNVDAVFVAVHFSQKILKLNKQTGEILQQYGSGTWSSQLGEFNYPNVSAVDGFDCVIVSDEGNDRFQVLHPDGKWEEIKLQRVQRIFDIVVLQGRVFILWYALEHDLLVSWDYKLSCYTFSSS